MSFRLALLSSTFRLTQHDSVYMHATHPHGEIMNIGMTTGEIITAGQRSLADRHACVSKDFDLSGNSLTLSLPTELGALSLMQNNFNLGSNLITGFIPTQLAQLTAIASSTTEFDTSSGGNYLWLRARRRPHDRRRPLHRQHRRQHPRPRPLGRPGRGKASRIGSRDQTSSRLSKPLLRSQNFRGFLFFFCWDKDPRER